MDSQDDTQKRTLPTDAPVAKRTYRRPELVEFGDVRELTRGIAKTVKEGRFTHKK
jgi:hypothetical protein